MRRRSGFPRLATDNGVLIEASAGRRTRPRLVVSRGPRSMDTHQVFNRKTVIATTSCVADGLPIPSGDVFSLLPLDHRPLGLSDIGSQLDQRIPNLEYIPERANAVHGVLITRDYPSRQRGTTPPVPEPYANGTISPMGRGVTPSEFKRTFCARIKLAREAAGLTPEEAAERVGAKVDTWRRYEKRLLVPHHLMPRVCEVLGQHSDYFFQYHPRDKESRKTA